MGVELPETTLSMTEVLLLDCQTTGASPRKGHLLEVAWCRVRAEETKSDTPPSVESLLVELPRGVTIPRPITRLTGLRMKDLAEAVEPEVVWQKLCEEANVVGGEGRRTAMAVAHYARFEESFLRDLHETHGDGGPFPLQLHCTVEIARRLLPNLPRRGLRALAGYLGHVMGPLKRAGAHVEATAVVWAELARRLEDQGIITFEDLRLFLRSPVPPRPSRPTFPLSREERLALPDAPGVYKMAARDGTVLYVGKATSLKKRFNSYFQKRKHDKAERTLELLTQARKVEVTRTGSPLEAALLETDEIKRLAPPYNKALQERDSHSWFRSRDLAREASRVDDEHPLGPLPRRESMDALARVRAWLELGGPPKGVSRVDCCRALGIPDIVNLDPDVCREGYRLFLRRSGLEVVHGDATASLLRLGAKLWRAALLQKARDTKVGDEEENDADVRVRDWTAEDAAGVFDGVVLHGARLLRRAHLLCQLTDCCILFQPQGASEECRRLLMLDRGEIARAEDVEASDLMLPPLPVGYSRGWRARQRVFGEATYDRLRVLTTELRRLLSEELKVTLRLGPRALLDERALKRRLTMV